MRETSRIFVTLAIKFAIAMVLYVSLIWVFLNQYLDPTLPQVIHFAFVDVFTFYEEKVINPFNFNNYMTIIAGVIILSIVSNILAKIILQQHYKAIV